MDLGFGEFQRVLRQLHFDNLDLEFSSNQVRANMMKTEGNETVDRCIACISKLEGPELVEFRCKHSWCNDCLEKKFKLALKDEQQYPPRCCYHVLSLDKEVMRRLSKPLVREFKSRQLELRTKNRTYCHKPNCSAFIAPHSIHNSEAICQKCNARTCSKCRGKWHFGPCSAGEHAEFEGYAGSYDWKRCPQCRRMVEKETGCNHMLCRCGLEWCYGCGNAYEKCNCYSSEDEMLRLERDDYDTDDDTSEDSEDLATTINDHEGQRHRDFRVVSARGDQFQCNICERSFYNWISRCEVCELNVCNFCRRGGGGRR